LQGSELFLGGCPHRTDHVNNFRTGGWFLANHWGCPRTQAGNSARTNGHGLAGPIISPQDFPGILVEAHMTLTPAGEPVQVVDERIHAGHVRRKSGMGSCGKHGGEAPGAFPSPRANFQREPRPGKHFPMSVPRGDCSAGWTNWKLARGSPPACPSLRTGFPPAHFPQAAPFQLGPSLILAALRSNLHAAAANQFFSLCLSGSVTSSRASSCA
jgi:hypothetical protein